MPYMEKAEEIKEIQPIVLTSENQKDRLKEITDRSMRDAPCAPAFLHASMMRFAFVVQSATTVSGLAAAVRKNP